MRKIAVQCGRRNRSGRRRVRRLLEAEMSHGAFFIVDAVAPNLRHNQANLERYACRPNGGGGR
jgi:hypothetical protein